MAYHRIECRLRRFDGAHPTPMPKYHAPQATAERIHALAKAWTGSAWQKLPRGFRRPIDAVDAALRRLALAFRTSIQKMRSRFGREDRKRNKQFCTGSI
jgi:hypothetical protein